MWKNLNTFNNKKPRFDKLVKYGFIKQDNQYKLHEKVNDTFSLVVSITYDGDTQVQVLDNNSHIEYTPIYVSSSKGPFVSSVREECLTRLQSIANQCFEADVYKSRQANLVIQYLRKKYDEEPEYLWEKFPTASAVRNKDTKKWYMTFGVVSKRKLGIEEDKEVEVITLKETYENICKIIDNERYFSGYHMNKKYWYTICLDESVSIEEIYNRIDRSVDIVLKI